jgi:hypothetical protein
MTFLSSFETTGVVSNQNRKSKVFDPPGYCVLSMATWILGIFDPIVYVGSSRITNNLQMIGYVSRCQQPTFFGYCHLLFTALPTGCWLRPTQGVGQPFPTGNKFLTFFCLSQWVVSLGENWV